MTQTTKIDLARDAYEKILSIKQSYSSFPPTAEEEAKEHDRVYWERVNVIRVAIDEAHGDGYMEGVRHEQKQ